MQYLPVCSAPSCYLAVSNATIKQGWTGGIDQLSGFVSSVFPGLLSLMAFVALISFLLRKI